LSRRWVVERTFSWFGRNRRLAKDWENLAMTLHAFVLLASIQSALVAFKSGSKLRKRPNLVGSEGAFDLAPKFYPIVSSLLAFGLPCRAV
jgi:hypothetical protein